MFWGMVGRLSLSSCCFIGLSLYCLLLVGLQMVRNKSYLQKK